MLQGGVGRGRICDRAVIHAAKPPRVVPVELKSGGGGGKLGQVFEKFSNAVGLLSRMGQDVFVGEECGAAMLLPVRRRRRASRFTPCAPLASLRYEGKGAQS